MENLISFVQIEIKIKLENEISLQLKRGLGPQKEPLPGVVMIQASNPIQIDWSKRTEKSFFGLASLTTNQHSIRSMIEEFDHYSDQLIETLDGSRVKYEIECRLMYFPAGLSGPKERIDSIVWRKGKYLQEAKKILQKEFFSRVLPPSIVLVLGFLILSNNESFLNRALYGLGAGVCTMIAIALSAPFAEIRKGLKREL